MAFTLVTVTGNYKKLDQTPASGYITFQATAEMNNAGVIEAPTLISETLVAGAISVALPATNDPATSPVGVTYTVTEIITGAPTRVWQLSVPYTASTLDLSTVAPALPSNPSFGYALDSTVVHLAGVETITGAKTFSGALSGLSAAFTGQVVGKTIGSYIWLPGGYARTDVGVQNAVNDLLAGNGGVIDLGNFTDYAFNGTVVENSTNPQGSTVRIIGAGIGSTVITQVADAPAFQLRGYLSQLEALQVKRTGGSTTSAVEVLDTMTPSLPGRVSLRRVQASGFLDGLLVDPAHGIDQLWIDECLFGANTQDGVHIVPGSGTALIDIQRSNTNNNGRHGINIFTSSVIGHINIRHPESVGNGGDSCRIEGSGTNTIISVLLENPDFEGVVTGSGSNSAFHAIYVWKLLLLIGQYSAKASNTAFSGIWLENCAEAEVVMPWIRRIADGQGTCTNELYVSGASTKKVRGRGLSYFGTDLNFTVDAATVPAGAVINMDSKTPPEIRAAAEGLVAQSFERVLMQSNTALVTQRAQVASVPVKANQKISTVYFGNSIAGTSVTLARVGIWNSAKALVASCVSDVTLVTSTGLRTATLTTPYTMPADGVLYVGVLAVFTGTAPSLSRLATEGTASAIGSGTLPYFSQSALADLPDPVVPGGASPICPWIGLA